MTHKNNAADAIKQRFLITGGAGFIGSHLADALLAQGAAVTIIDNLSTGRFENIQHLVGQPGFRFAIDTITNREGIANLVRWYQENRAWASQTEV